MSNFIMQVDFFGNDVRCETEDLMISLTDLTRAGNKWRAMNGLANKTLGNIIDTDGFKNFVKIVSSDLNMPEDKLVRVDGKGKNKRTMAHLFISVYVAEQFSPEFHYKVIKTFVEGRLLEFRQYGSDEFKSLNRAIDYHLPEREGKDSNMGIYINMAKIIRTNILGENATTDDWNKATVDQIRKRYETEHQLVRSLELGLVKNYDHLKDLANRIDKVSTKNII